MIGDLSGRTVIVTGARGFLGEAVCAEIAYDGANVIGLDLDPYYGRGIQGVQFRRADVTSPASLSQAYDDLKDMGIYDAPDGLVCLHGIDSKPSMLDSDPWRSWEEMLEVNLTGTFHVCRMFGEAMAARGKGSIVTIGSLYASHAPDQKLYDDGFVKPAAYSASKAGVLGLTRWMAAYWAKSGVRVNCVSPGGIGSDTTPPDFRSRFEARVPMGRMGRPEDLVGAITWLLSDSSSYVTGQEIVVDGGFSAW